MTDTANPVLRLKNAEFRPLPNISVCANRSIGDDQPCFIIAEIGQNHNGEMQIARDLIDHAAALQADAVKFCKRHIPSDMTAEMYAQPYLGPQSFGETYGKHREFLELSIEQYRELKTYSESQGLVFFATACDQHSVDELESLNLSIYKIASRDLSNLPLIDRVAQTGKPILLSCGMDGLEEIDEALNAVRRRHDRVVLMQCTSAYPTPYPEVNLRAIQSLRRRFDVLVGLSDHTIGIAMPVVAAALGAVAVEKHITLARYMKGTDHSGSLEPDGLRRVVRDIRNVELALGDGVKRISPAAAQAARTLRRSIVSRQSIPRGTVITEEMLGLKSPGTGLKWRERGRVVGRCAALDIPADVVLREEDTESPH